AVSDRALVSNVPTSVRDWGDRDSRQGNYTPEEVLGVTDSNEDSRRAVWASTVAVPDGTDQAGNIGPQAAEAAEESAKGVSCVGNIGPQLGNIGPQAGNVVPQAGNIGPQAAEAAGEDAESAPGVGNRVPRMVEETEKIASAAAGAVHLEALPEVSALLNLEELSMKDFLAELKTGEIGEMVLLKLETSPEDLNSSFAMDENVLEEFAKQRATRLCSEILENPVDPVYPLVKEYSDVVSKHPPSQLPPDWGAIDAFIAEKSKAGMLRELKSPHSIPTFCVRADSCKDDLLNNMSGCTLYSALDLVDGYY
ncbi:Pol protein, partial [Phytophthora palmivora]